MPRLFIGNFSFEQAWQPGQNPTHQVLRLEAELACIWLAVAEPEDEILCPEPIAAEFWSRMEKLGCQAVRRLTPNQLQASRADEIVPWGWTPAVRDRAARLKISPRAPAQEVIWEVNAREFAFRICEEQGCLLPGEGLARTVPEALALIETVQADGPGWVIKPNQGQAGRGQLRGTSLPTGKELATLTRLLDRQGVVHVEPLLFRHVELSGQWDLPESGEPRFLGLTELFTDARGTYQGTGFQTLRLPTDIEQGIIQVQRAALARLQSAEYFGPVGIDAMVAQRENESLVRPIQDLNARWTMGRMGWEWGQRQFAGGFERAGIWSHSPTSPGPGSLLLSPELIQGKTVRQRTWWTPSSNRSS